MKASISQEKISKTAVRLGIPDHPFVARRIARAYDLVATNKVNEISHDDGLYRVHSQYDDKIYTVELNHGNPHCTCPDNERTIFCKHSIASMMLAQAQAQAQEQAQEQKASKLTIYDDTFDKRNGAEGFARDNTAMRHSKYGRWIVNDYKVRKGYVVYRSREACEAMAPREHGKLHCACGKKNCRHCKAIRLSACIAQAGKVTAEGVPSEDGIAPRDDGAEVESHGARWRGRRATLASHRTALEHSVRLPRAEASPVCSIARDNTAMRIENECGTETAKALQEKLNGDKGTGDTKSPSHKLDASDPFQECEMLDIDQIEGRSNGDLVHVLSNGEYVVSYHGIMKLAEQHNVTFEALRHDETRTVIAYGRCGNNSRASGKPINGAEMTALELAKRNTARQLLPLPEIKALEHKVKLEVERGAIRLKKRKPSAPFNWQVAKRKCLEIVPDFTFDILINDLIKAGTLRQAHSSDYSRKEWLVIFDACKRDAEINSIDDDDGGDNPPSSEQQVSCAICSRTLTNPESVRLQVGPICREKIGIKGEAHLHGNIISEELLQASELYSDEALRKRIIKACLTLDAPLPVKVLRWLGNEYFGYKNRPILYYICAAGQLNRIDTHRRRLRHVIVTSETAETELDAHALAQWSTQAKPRSRVSPAAHDAAPSERKAEVPDNADEFVAKCKEIESEVDESATAPMVEGAQMGGDGKRKLQMDRKKNILLIEPDGTETPITMRDTAFTYGSNYVLRLTTGIACGGDISTVELD